MDVRHAVVETARWVRYGCHYIRNEAVALARSAGRVRHPGAEREQLIQSAKAAGAALLAWVLAAYVLHSPVALMAPWVALVLVQSTVYRSVLKGVQQLVAIAIGAVLALALEVAVGNTLIALAIALPVMLLLAQWRHFGAEGIYGATTALFVLAYGPQSWGGVLDRMVEAALGAAVGVAVNAFVHPPVLLRRGRTWVRSIGGDLHELLTEMARGLSGDVGYDRARAWHARVDGLDRSLEYLRSTLSWARESLALNPARTRYLPTQPERSYQTVAAIFERLVDHVSDVTRTLVDDADETRAVATGDVEERISADTLRSYGVFLREVAGGVLAFVGRVTAEASQDDSTARLDETTKWAEAAFDRFRVQVRRSGIQERSAALGALLFAGHRLLSDMGEMRASAADEEVSRPGS